MVKSIKRILSLYMSVALCFMAILLRIAYINFSSYSSAAENQGTRTLTIGTTRGIIYDRNFERLTNINESLVAVVTPVIGAEKYIGAYLEADALADKLKDGYPFTLKVNEEINNELIRTFKVYDRYVGDNIAPHLIGYLSSEGRGIYGVEKAFDSFLTQNSGSLTVTFDVDALGRVLAGMDKTVTDNAYNNHAGIAISIDRKVQSLTEKALEESSIKSGCAIVMHIESGELYALASVPEFDRDNLADSMESEYSPFLNKALLSYSAGSVFKSIIAAAALEQGISEEYTYNCTGKLKIGDKEFTCHVPHGKADMKKALAESCNTYFISLAKELDRERLCSLCSDMGFGKAIHLCDGVEGEKGALPTADSLYIEGNLANFAFGQGDLSVTPLQILKAYHILATGKAAEPTLIIGKLSPEGKLERENKREPDTILKESTVIKMRNMLYTVTEEGIGYNAKSGFIKLAGKTGTAETGIADEAGEIYRTWFAGFFPADNPHYIVVVLNEDGVSGNYDCAPVFKKICEGIAVGN